MCQAAGKLFNDFSRLGTTKEFVNELSSVTGIPVTGLTLIKQGGRPQEQGTWVRPEIATALAWGVHRSSRCRWRAGVRAAGSIQSAKYREKQSSQITFVENKWN
jgi:hypothetical protein